MDKKSKQLRIYTDKNGKRYISKTAQAWLSDFYGKEKIIGKEPFLCMIPSEKSTHYWCELSNDEYDMLCSNAEVLLGDKKYSHYTTREITLSEAIEPFVGEIVITDGSVDIYKKFLEAYRRLYESHLEEHEQLRQLRIKYIAGEVSYDEYVVFARHVRENDIRIEKSYQWLMDFYYGLAAYSRKGEFVELSDEQLEVHYNSFEVSEEEKKKIKTAIDKRDKIKELGTPEQPIAPEEILDNTLDELLNAYLEALEEYKTLYKEYKSEHDKLDQLVMDLKDGKIPYSEYRKQADYVIEKDHYMRGQHDQLMVLYYKVISRGKSKNYGDASAEQLYALLDDLENHHPLRDDDKIVIAEIQRELERREKYKKLEKPEASLTTELILDKVNEHDNQDKVTVTFLNNGIGISNYTNILLDKGTVIHGPVIPPVPIGNDGKRKKFTMQIFDCWVDEYNNPVDFSQPVTKSMTLSARYKFDKHKAFALGTGAAVGVLAYLTDTALLTATAVPVISLVGAVGFGAAAVIKHKQLSRLISDNRLAAGDIVATDSVPEELAENIDKERKQGFLNTFLKTSAISCAISALIQFVKPRTVEKQPPKDVILPKKEIPPTDAIPSGAPNNIVPPVVDTDVLGTLDLSKASAYQTAADAVNGVNARIPYWPSYVNPIPSKAYFNGIWFDVHPGQSIKSILEMTGASNIGDVAIEVINGNTGELLTWAKGTQLVSKAVGYIK